MTRRFYRTGIGIIMAAILALGAYLPGAHAQRAHASVTITVWTAYNHVQLAAFQELMRRFESKYPDISVTEVSSANYGALQQKEQSAVVAGNTPTVAQGYENWVAQFANQGVVQDLTPYVKNKKDGMTKKDIADFFAKDWADGLLGKHRYMMPFSKSDIVFYFDGPMLRKYGIKSPPTTWAQFAKDCKKVTDSGSNPSHWCMTLEEYTSNFYAWEYEWGQPVLKGQHAIFATKSGAAALSFWQSLVKKHEVVVSTTPNYQGQADFDAGKTPFYIGSSAGLSFVKAGARPGVGVGERPFPKGPKRQATELYGAPMFMFNKGTSAEKRAGWLFLKFITSPSSTAYWAMQTGYMPVRHSALKQADLKQFYKENPQLRAATDQLDHALIEPAYSGWTKARDDITKAVETTLQGNVPPMRSLKSLQQQVNSDLQAG